MLDNTRVLVTGRLWMGTDGTRAIGPALIEMIKKAKQEVMIVAYRLTVAHEELGHSLESALARGCIVTIVLDRSGAPVAAEDSFLNRLLKNYHNWVVWDFHETSGSQNVALHAKLVIVDRRTALIGSANFSRNGLVENHELALSVAGKTARSLCTAVESLIQQATKAGVVTKRSAG